MSKITVDSLVVLIKSRDEQLQSEEASEEIQNFIKGFYDIGNDLNEKAPSGYIRNHIENEGLLVDSSLSLLGDSVELHYNFFDNIIDVVVSNKGKETMNVDILTQKPDGIFSARMKRTVQPGDMLNYFDQAQTYRDLFYLSKK